MPCWETVQSPFSHSLPGFSDSFQKEAAAFWQFRLLMVSTELERTPVGEENYSQDMGDAMGPQQQARLRLQLLSDGSSVISLAKSSLAV